MIYSQRPVPALRRLVRYYYQVEDKFDAAIALQPVPARSPEIIEFMFATPYSVERLHRGTIEKSWPSTFVGAKTHRHVNLFLSGTVDAFTNAFQPGGVAALFGISSDELTDLDFDASVVLGSTIRLLRDRLGEVSQISDRARIADEYFLGKRSDFLQSTPLVRAARMIQLSRGSVRIANLVDQVDLGMRQFERRFTREIGISPKLYARIVRFEAALQMKSASTAMRWTDVAHALGYHDQMHMIHDFDRLAGDTPTGIIDRLDMFVKPEVESRRAIS